MFLYPVYAHMYLELVASEKADEAHAFKERFAGKQDSLWAEDLARLARATTPAHLESNELLEAFSTEQFHLKMSKESMGALKPLLENQPVLAGLLRKHLEVESVESAPRSAEAVAAASGGLLGEPAKGANKTKMLYGIPRDEPTAAVPVPQTGEEEESGNTPSKKKKSSSAGKDKKRSDPNAPPFDRIPLPELSESMKAERKQAQRDISKRLKIGPKDLPSVCLYTVLNHQGVCSGEISEDSTLAYLGLANSGVSVHALSPKALRPLKSLSELQLLDKEADDVETSMLDDAAAQSTVRISGHSGPVTGVSGSADKRLLLSASLDGTLRLSSLHLWTNLAVYRLAGYPFWDVAFCSRGYYFASGGADKLGLLWTTDRMQPLRLLAGHYADVNAVEWHPNCNYVATASADRSVRVFDLLNGNAVRHLVGHRSSVETLRWSPDGRYLASGSADGAILVWDIATGRLFASAASPLIPAPVASLAFSRDGGVLAHGGRDRAVSLLSLACPDPMRGSGEAAVASEAPGSSLASFPTKATPIVNLHWTRKNVLLGLGAFETTAS